MNVDPPALRLDAATDLMDRQDHAGRDEGPIVQTASGESEASPQGPHLPMKSAPTTVRA